ncbi:MAG TPA: ATP-binding protein [Candidatus Saccharimonadales bacterium]|nr:ATP-binding protein [Candidatus Saccharimonadales bacterium]
MIRLKVSQRVLLLLLATSLVPLAAVGLTWFRLSESSLKDSAASEQTILTSNAASSVNQFIADKVNLLIIHSQTVSIRGYQANLANASADIQSLIKQDADIKNVSLADQNGMERLSISQNGPSATLANVSQSSAFRVATFLAGKEYISPVGYDSSRQPYITIAVPLVTYDSSQTSSDLSTDESGVIRSAGAIKGVLITQISLASLWRSVLSEHLGANGYAYVVDGQGNLIAYPDMAFLLAHRSLSTVPAVAAFIADPGARAHPIVTASEKGVAVLSSYQQVPATGWGVVAEEPTGTIYASANRIADIGFILFGTMAAVVVAASYSFSRRFTRPLEQLAAGARLLSDGQLDARIDVQQHSEIGTLADTFNAMAANISTLIRRSQADSSKLNVILNNVGEGVVATDKTGTIVVANVAAAVLVGNLPKSIIGKPLTAHFGWTKGGRPFEPALTKTSLYHNVTLISPNQRAHFLDILVNHIENDPMGISTIFTMIDKTNERELESMKTDFVSMAAHELRTPMTTIRGYLDLILQDKDANLTDETKDHLLRIQANSRQLVGLINNLLSVSRIERGELTLHLDKVDWIQAVRQVVNDQLFMANAKSVTLSYSGPTEPLYILADEIAITEVINNLVTNAINYTDVGGRVTVTIRSTPDGVLTFVQDNGMGISTNDQAHLFTKFYRANGGLASGKPGTGLGLYISQAIARLHGGSISVASEEHKGSTFTITLPHIDLDHYNQIRRTTAPGILKGKHGWVTKNISR